MFNQNDTIRIIEKEINAIETKLLWIRFDSISDLKLLFLPNLENIGFVQVDNSVTINLRNPSLQHFFNDWVIRFCEKMSSVADSIERVEIFNYEIKSIVQLGQKEQKLAVSSARGLFGELLLLKNYLEEGVLPKQELLDGWHRPAPANHDFDYEDGTLEVKTCSRGNTTIKITSEHQLMAIDNKPLHLKFYRIETVSKNETDSLGNLFNAIKDLLEQPVLINQFEIKCAEDKFCKYPGPNFMPLDYKFLLIEEKLFNVDQKYFPRVRKEQLDNGISKTSYNIDISAIDEFQIS